MSQVMASLARSDLTADAIASRSLRDLAELHALCAQILRYRTLVAIMDEFRCRYPSTVWWEDGFTVAADWIYADILTRRRQCCGGAYFARTAEFETVPESTVEQWRAADASGLQAGYVRYVTQGLTARLIPSLARAAK